MSEVIKMEAEALPSAVDSSPIMSLVERAVMSDVPMEKLDRLMDLEERRNRERYRIEFEEAFARAKPNYKPMKKTGNHATFGAYSTLSDMDDAISDALAAQGLTYRWRTEQSDGRISVSCIMSGHGHYEENSLFSSPDTTGSKAGPQQTGSAQKYLMRYTLEAAAGVALSDNDDDGAFAETQDTKIVAEWRETIGMVQNRTTLTTVTGPAIASADMTDNERNAIRRIYTHRLQKLSGATS